MTAFTFSPELEDALTQQAQRLGMTPERLVQDAVREKLATVSPSNAQDEWEHLLDNIATNAGVSLTNEQASSENYYD